MVAIRKNIMSNPVARDDFLDAMTALDSQDSGFTTADLANRLRSENLPLSISGVNQLLTTYDIFVFWHWFAMQLSGDDDFSGNAAHDGPIFLPWHRMYMLRLEEKCQEVLGKDDFGIPYWDWAADGELPVHEQWQTDLWSENYIGEARGEVRSGKISEMQVRLANDTEQNILRSMEPRPIIRGSGIEINTLPTKAQVNDALNQTEYDRSPWNTDSISHRNILEGWYQGPQLHNRVHVWIGGDMSLGTSPNDPAFFLNHCNVDRIWELWMGRHGRIYTPPVSGDNGPEGHRINSQMVAVIGDSLTPQDILDPSAWYTYED